MTSPGTPATIAARPRAVASTSCWPGPATSTRCARSCSFTEAVYAAPMSVTLREVVDDDLPLFYEDQADPVAYTMAGFKSRDREAFMAHWARIRVAPDTWIRTITVDGQV